MIYVISADRNIAIGPVLKAFLDLLPISFFVSIFGELLKDATSPYRISILATFKSRVASEPKRDSQDVVLGFLPELKGLLQDITAPVELRAETILCLSIITDKYGNERQDAIYNVVDAIIGPTAFGSYDTEIQVLSLRALLSLIRSLKGRIIPYLPNIASRALDLLETEISQDSPSFLIHNAVYPLLEDLINTIPNFMPSYLQRILALSYTAAAKQGSAREASDNKIEENNMLSASPIRSEFLAAAAIKIPAKYMVRDVFLTIPSAMKSGPESFKELTVLLSQVIENCPKPDFIHIQEHLFKIFSLAFDIRTTMGNISDIETEELEESLFKAMLQMVYKLNDKVFRPFFNRLLKWANQDDTNAPSNTESTKVKRLRTFYGFFNMFLENLGSIVTNYYGHVLNATIEILTSIHYGKGYETLLNLTLNSLLKSFSNDQDDFWQTPVNFEKIRPALMKQLELPNSPITSIASPSEENISLVISTICEFSIAAHSEEHAKSINSAVLSGMKNDNAKVRLLSVKVMMELYERHKEEWIGMLPESMPAIAELMEDDDEEVEKETHKLIMKIEEYYGESLDNLLT